jgi:hypothetical protein
MEKLYLGVDLHKRSCWVTVLDADGRVLESWRHPRGECPQGLRARSLTKGTVPPRSLAPRRKNSVTTYGARPLLSVKRVNVETLKPLLRAGLITRITTEYEVCRVATMAFADRRTSAPAFGP